MDLRDLRGALRRKLGAEESREKKHVFLFISVKGVVYRVAKFSHSWRGGRIPDFAVSDTANRLKLSGPELDQLVQCNLSRDSFFELWQNRNAP